jgi:hypothetical protein
VDASLPLPTIGQEAAQASGSVSAAPVPETPSSAGETATSVESPIGGQAETQTKSGSASSTTAKGGATQSKSNPLSIGDASIASCALGLLTVGLAVVLLL